MSHSQVCYASGSKGVSYLLLICVLLGRLCMASVREMQHSEDGEFSYSVPLDSEGHLKLLWKVSYESKLVYFRLRAHFRKPAWFGAGFSDHGEVASADVFIFWTEINGLHHFQDGWTDQDGFINIDTQQDYKLKASFRDDDEMVLDFSRAFDTCDDKDYQFDNGTTHIIYFIGEGSPSGINDIQVPTLLHGVQRVQLLKPDWPDVKMPDDVTVIDITVPSIHVPSRETTYWWYVARLPSFRTKHHVIKYEAVIDKGHEGLVHHMELFHCEVPPGTHIPEFNGPGPGKGEEKPSRLSSCQQVLGAWAMGAKAMVYPEEAGIPVGGEHFSPFVLLEIHYNNPSRIPDLVDSSGMRFYVTSKLRAHDAGLLQIGLEYTDKMAIPPHQKLFTLTGYCVPQCTRVALPPSGITIFASQLHSHLTGRRMRTKHVRFGVELPEVNRDDHYSPHFQEIRRLQHPVKVLPGDALITYCDDSTFDRDHVTTGGLSIQQEMCVNYVHYYPRVKLELCKSSVDTRTLNAFFNFMSVMENEETAADKTPSANYETISWTPLNVHLLKALYREAPLTVLCNRSDGTSFPGEWEGVTKPRIQIPILEPARECSKKMAGS